jgi:hypothetical protein
MSVFMNSTRRDFKINLVEENSDYIFSSTYNLMKEKTTKTQRIIRQVKLPGHVSHAVYFNEAIVYAFSSL